MADTTELAGLPSRVDAVEKNLTEFRVEVRQEFASVRQEIRETRQELRTEIRESSDETRRYMRVLYEDLVQRITTIGGG